MSRHHTADCYADGCTTGAHPAPRPGHRMTGGPWTPEQVLGGAVPTALADATDPRFTDGQRAQLARFEAAPIPAEVLLAHLEIDEVEGSTCPGCTGDPADHPSDAMTQMFGER